MLELLQLLDVAGWIDKIRRGGKGHKITWQRELHNGTEVEAFLRSYGVRIIDRQLATKRREPGVYVSDKQAKYADGLLRGAGFAITSVQLSPPIAPRHRWGSAAKDDTAGGLYANIFGVGALADELARSNARPRRERRNARPRRPQRRTRR